MASNPALGAAGPSQNDERSTITVPHRGAAANRSPSSVDDVSGVMIRDGQSYSTISHSIHAKMLVDKLQVIQHNQNLLQHTYNTGLIEYRTAGNDIREHAAHQAQFLSGGRSLHEWHFIREGYSHALNVAANKMRWAVREADARHLWLHQ